MPLYCAAQWIATEGGTISFDPCDENVWKPAYEQLLARIASEEINIIGIQNGEKQPVPGFHFAGCRIDYPFVEEPFDLLLSEDLYLSSFAYFDEQHWLKGHDDSLQNRRGRQWGATDGAEVGRRQVLALRRSWRAASGLVLGPFPFSGVAGGLAPAAKFDKIHRVDREESSKRGGLQTATKAIAARATPGAFGLHPGTSIIGSSEGLSRG